jgi:hypothetical protein
VGKDAGQRSRHGGKVERLDEQRGVSDLAVPHEPVELLLAGQVSLLALLLEGAECGELALALDDLLDGIRAERARELVLEILDADEEAEPLHPGPVEVHAKTGPLERTSEMRLLANVAESRQFAVQPSGTESSEEVADRLGSSDRHDGDALDDEISTEPARQGLDRTLVADPFDEHDRTRASRHDDVLPVVIAVARRRDAESIAGIPSLPGPPEAIWPSGTLCHVKSVLMMSVLSDAGSSRLVTALEPDPLDGARTVAAAAST